MEDDVLLQKYKEPTYNQDADVEQGPLHTTETAHPEIEEMNVAEIT